MWVCDYAASQNVVYITTALPLTAPRKWSTKSYPRQICILVPKIIWEEISENIGVKKEIVGNPH
jgi:hypothetical protein